MKTISNFLKGNNKINWLSLGNNSKGLNAEENLKLIFEGLNGNKNFKKLSLSENDFSTFNEYFGLIAE